MWSSALETLIERRVRATPVAPLVGRAIDLAIEGGHHQRLLDCGAEGARSASSTRTEPRSGPASSTSRRGGSPSRIDDRLFAKIYGAVHGFLADVGCRLEP